MYKIKDKSDTKAILNNLSELRFTHESQEDFWIYYLENILALTKSNVAFALIKEQESWSLKREKINNGDIENSKDAILKTGVFLAQRALGNVFAYEKFNDANHKINNHSIVALELKESQENQKMALLLLLSHESQIEFSNMILRTSLVNDVPKDYYLRLASKSQTNAVLAPSVTTEPSSESALSHVLEMLNAILDEKNFLLASMKIVDEFANRYNCSKVTLGWAEDFYVKPVAISHVENFQKSSHAVSTLEAIYEESFDQDEEIFYPKDRDGVLITTSHERYAFENNLASLYSFPIRLKNENIGVASFEKIDATLTQKELETIRLSLNYIAPIFNDVYKKDKNVFQRLFMSLKEGSKTIFGPQKSLQKLSALLVLVVILIVMFGKLPYKVEGVTTIKTDDISYLCAPYDGIIEKVNIDNGDSVSLGDLLVEFDTEELSFKRLEISSEIVKYNRETEKARASRSLAEMKISLAKKEQAISSLNRVEYYMSQSKIKAPFSGIIVEGEREKLNGAPFSKGDIIIQIANSTNLYAKIKISEEDIDEIKLGQIVEINLLSRPEERFMGIIDKIIPMANVDDVNGNVFGVNVLFTSEIQKWMRPGMSGLAKIEIEERSILWILTHKLSDYFRMYFWY